MALTPVLPLQPLRDTPKSEKSTAHQRNQFFSCFVLLKLQKGAVSQTGIQPFVFEHQCNKHWSPLSIARSRACRSLGSRMSSQAEAGTKGFLQAFCGSGDGGFPAQG